MLLKAPARVAHVPRSPVPPSLRFDRRAHRRTNTCGRAVATFIDPDGCFHLSWMDVLDTSDAGLGLRGPVLVPHGSIISLHLPQQSLSSRLTRISPVPFTAQVVSCRLSPAGSDYRIGLILSRRSAA